MSDSVRPHRPQPTRLPRPWDSPGKNTRVGCRFLLQCMKVKSESEVSQSCPPPSDPMDCSPPGSPVPGILQARTLEWVAIAFSENTMQMFLISHWKVEIVRMTIRSYTQPTRTSRQILIAIKLKWWKKINCAHTGEKKAITYINIIQSRFQKK